MAAILPLRSAALSLAADVDAWLSEYPNARTRQRYGASLTAAVRATGAQAPGDLSPDRIAAWLADTTRANNSVRADVTAIRAFLRWCQETGRLPVYRDRPLRRLLASYPATYGKVQANHPAVRLSHDEYDTLLAACADGTEAGLRDELLIRLGVAGGMRTSELLAATVGMVRRAPRLTWTGKARKQRTATAGPALVAAIGRYLDQYAAAIGRPLTDDDPLFCPARHSRCYPDELRWGQAITTTAGIRGLLQRRARKADLAYLSPHDLKRSAARMMFDARSPDGGHLFDLLEIAEVLDHSNPKVTKDCYVGPLDNTTKDRAAALFG